MNSKSLGKCTPTSCPKGGIKIHESNNNYKCDPFSNIISSNNAVPCNNKILDLNIDNYSMDDLYNLFSIKTLNEETLKESKKIVLKTHPDKSNLDPKYFLFFSKAYKRLYGIYEFQNKSNKKTVPNSDYTNTENGKLLNNMFQNNKSLKDPNNFNKWFNEQFDKHKIDDANENGYGEWLKSNDGIYDVGNVTKANMAQEFEKQKKQIQALTVYTGVNEQYSSVFGGSLLGHQENYTAEGGSYTDLRQAYVESVIPVTEDDYNNIPKYRNVEEYKNNRNSVDVKPIDKELAMKKLYERNQKDDQESAAIAYYYAKQTEKANKQNQTFWASLKQLTNF